MHRHSFYKYPKARLLAGSREPHALACRSRPLGQTSLSPSTTHLDMADWLSCLVADHLARGISWKRDKKNGIKSENPHLYKDNGSNLSVHVENPSAQLKVLKVTNTPSSILSSAPNMLILYLLGSRPSSHPHKWYCIHSGPSVVRG
jgi:hypothetical protein